MKKILIIFGTRPEAIKMAPVVHQFQRFPQYFETRVCVTAQHRDMLDQVLNFFDIQPEYDLDLMQANQSLNALSARILNGLNAIFADYKPDYIFVHGDTTTSMVAALAAFYAGIKVCHIEAGLRTFNKYSPYPEEINRQLTGRLADFHFAPTEIAKNNLLKEGVNPEQIQVTGNTVIDALFYTLPIVKEGFQNIKGIIDIRKDIILVTGHRRENHGDGIKNICSALKELSLMENIEIIYPVHPNPQITKPVIDMLSNIPNIHLIDPLSYPEFVWLMSISKIIITDSGGIQEEAPSLGKPVLVMRDTTERPEAVEAGTVKLVGTNTANILSEAKELLSNEQKYLAMSRLENPYGDGKAAQRIVDSFIKGQGE